MAWFTDRHCFLLAVTFYGLSTIYSVFLWRKGFRRDDWVNYILLAGGVALHTLAMAKRGMTLHSCPVNNLYEATTFLLWALGLASLVYALLPRFKFLCAFTSPVLFTVGVFALMPSLDPHGAKPEFSGALRSLHAATILQAYGAFGLAAVAAAMFLVEQHDLKFHKIRAVLSQLPSIQRLEMITARLIFVGFMLLTIGLPPDNNCRVTRVFHIFPTSKLSGPRCSGSSISKCSWRVDISDVRRVGLPPPPSRRFWFCS